MIETRFNVPITINEKTFNVIVRELTPAEKKKLDMIADENKVLIEQEDEKNKKMRENEICLEEAQTTLETNKNLLELVEFKDKVSLFLENKKLGFEIAKLKREKLSLERADFTKVGTSLEALLKEKTEFVVEGDEKDALMHEIVQNNISYQRLWDEIDKEITKQNEKKLNASEDGQSK